MLLVCYTDEDSEHVLCQESAGMVAIIDLERGIGSKQKSSARADYDSALCTHQPSLLPIDQICDNFELIGVLENLGMFPLIYDKFH